MDTRVLEGSEGSCNGARMVPLPSVLFGGTVPMEKKPYAKVAHSHASENKPVMVQFYKDREQQADKQEDYKTQIIHNMPEK